MRHQPALHVALQQLQLSSYPTARALLDGVKRCVCRQRLPTSPPSVITCCACPRGAGGRFYLTYLVHICRWIEDKMRFDIQALGSDDEMVLTVWPEAHMRLTRQQVRVWAPET